MEALIFALRGFSLAFLAWHAALLLPGLAEPPLVALAAVVGLAGGSAVRAWRWELALAAALVFAGAFALVVTQGPVLLAGTRPSVLDTLPLWADRQLLLGALPFALGWLEGWLFTLRPKRRAAERLVHAAVAVAVFWSQGPYHVTFYPHPLGLAAAVGLFLASEWFLLGSEPRRMAVPAAASLIVLLGLAFLWSLLGRYEDQSTASGGGLMKPDLFQFDFAPLVRLEDEITLGDSLVLLYREEGTPRTRYLRRMVLEDYNQARGFSVTGGRPPALGRRPVSFAVDAQERVPVRQEYYLVNLDPSSLLTLNEATQVTPYAQWNQSSFVNAYRVDSLVASDDFWLFNEATGDRLAPDQRTRLTAGADDELGTLAREITRGTTTRFEQATAIEQYLRTQYFYSLKPGAPGSRGALKHFLFEGKKGYCSYFAFSMALLLRSLDIPARIAVGFVTNPDEAVLGFTPVRAFQAHAWVEVPLGPYGWITFDPTSSTPAPGEPFQFPRGTDPQALSRLISEILGAHPEPLGEATASTAEAPRWLSDQSFWTTLLLVAALLINEAFRWQWAWRAFTARGPAARFLVQWHHLLADARRARIGPLPDDTPESWAARLDDARTVAAEASRARYAAIYQPRNVRPALQALRARWRARRPWYHRLASVVFPWWPR